VEGQREHLHQDVILAVLEDAYAAHPGDLGLPAVLWMLCSLFPQEPLWHWAASSG